MLEKLNSGLGLLLGLLALVSAIGAGAVFASDSKKTQETVEKLVVWADANQAVDDKQARNQKMYTWCASQTPPISRDKCPVEK